MKALVISGGGSKGAFAGGVAQYLIENLNKKYDLFLGTSTGSLLISHLALGKINKIKKVYTSVNEKSIFSISPFRVVKRHGIEHTHISYRNLLRNFLRGSKTFGESHNLKELISKTITREEFWELKSGNKEIIVTVSNLSLDQVEFKSLDDYSYEDFIEWVWISCNYIPFMSLVRKNGCEYADGGLGNMVPIEEAIKRGATEIDAVILATEDVHLNRMPSKDPFSLMINMFTFMLDRIEHQNIRIGKFVANHNDAIINLYYTPTVLTTNSLIFDKEKMSLWWQKGFDYAQRKDHDLNEIGFE